MDKLLKLKVYVDGGINDTPFPDSDNQIALGEFRYDAKRMGGAPTISASVYYPSCLDDVWIDMVYTELNGERYFLKQTPTSSKSNDDARYKHDLIFVAERVILDNAYFFDAVIGDPLENDKPVTNSTKFHFYGNIEDFVRRMNSSLQYTNLQKVDEEGNVISGYYVVLDEDVTKREDKLVSFNDAFFSQALQEAYNTFGVPFYFNGKEIHVGYSTNIIEDVLEYGVDGALLSATKQNANFKVVNRATGTGASENIPYYYPNNSPKGNIEAEVNTTTDDFYVKVEDYDKYAEEISVDEEIRFVKDTINIDQELQKNSQEEDPQFGKVDIQTTFYTVSNSASQSKRLKNITLTPHSTLSFRERGYDIEDAQNVYENIYDVNNDIIIDGAIKVFLEGDLVSNEKYLDGLQTPTNITIPINSGYSEIKVVVSVTVRLPYDPSMILTDSYFSGECSFSITTDEDEYYWSLNNKAIDLSKLGLLPIGTPNVGDTITQRLIKKVNTSSTLQPSIYRATDGKERFYNAINYPFTYEEGYELKYGEYVLDGEVHNDVYKRDDGTYYRFTNEYKEGRPREHVFSVGDIKPTIKEMTNNISWVEQDEEGNDKTVFQRIDMFSEFAYNIDDNDETYIDPNGNTSFKHPYFFAKLRKLDFNLFDSASELGEMTFSMTSGNCGACNFKIGVSDDYPQFNTVQVWEEDTTDENGVFHKAGSLKYDENGYVLCGLEDFQDDVEWQDRQQDTVNYEVWIALKKEDDTYGILMPKAPVDGVGGHRPVACSSEKANDGDTFVILNINLPDEYIYKAEKKLEKAIVKYIWENNVEKFNFSVNFSRIFLEENPSILNALNENARLTRVKYNGEEYVLYVSSYSYSMNEGDVLPEIRIELDDTLTISQNTLQNAINEVKSDIASAINAIDVAAIGSRYFLRKDTFDTSEAPINFKGGIFFGEGGDVSYYEDGSAKLTIDYLEVTKKATFTSLEIQEKTHAGGQILVTPAAMTCSYVEELEDAYRCYFQNKGEGGAEIFNTFTVGDLAISQTYNAWGSKFYWRFVSSVGENYIDLSKNDCAPESDVPSIGDKIIQLGNRVDKTRQNAIVIASYGDGSPYIIQYKGINSFALTEDKVVTKLSSTENIFTGIVHIKDGSDGFSELGDFSEIINESIQGIEVGGQNMLRNSGFTGDYLSAQLADQTVLDAAGEMFNPPLVHWDTTGSVEVVDLTGISVSGKGVEISYGKISQETYNSAIYSETYVVSFKAKSQSEGSSLDIRFGGITTKKDITTDWDKYIVLINANTPINEFYVESIGVVTICDLQLERGTIASSWGNSFLDNQSDRAYYQAGVYVQQALHEGSTTIGGGLVLTNHVKVGQYANKEMIQETGGMQGSWTNDNDVFIWGGGSLEEAENAVEENGDDEANFVVTHGGKAILNDAVVRGTIYARDGEFTGKVNANSGNFGEGCTIGDDFKIEHIDGTTHIRTYAGPDVYDGYVGISKYGISVYQLTGKASAVSLNRDSLYTASFINGRAGFSPASDKDNIAIVLAAKDGYAVWAEEGMFAGLRPRSREVSGEVRLDHLDHTIFAPIPNTTLWLPSTPIEGQEYVILVSKGGVNVMGNGKSIFCFDGQDRTEFKCGDFAQRIEVRLYWNKVANQWWATFFKY
jgi:hypothetical protein